jgi:hypothetical protein
MSTDPFLELQLRFHNLSKEAVQVLLQEDSNQKNRLEARARAAQFLKGDLQPFLCVPPWTAKGKYTTTQAILIVDLCVDAMLALVTRDHINREDYELLGKPIVDATKHPLYPGDRLHEH